MSCATGAACGCGGGCGRVGVAPGTLTLWPNGSVTAGIGEVTIPDSQRTVHVAAETVAVFAVVPFMTWLAMQRDLPGWARVVSGVIAAGTLIIDGGLLWKFVMGNDVTPTS